MKLTHLSISIVLLTTKAMKGCFSCTIHSFNFLSFYFHLNQSTQFPFKVWGHLSHFIFSGISGWYSISSKKKKISSKEKAGSVEKEQSSKLTGAVSVSQWNRRWASRDRRWSKWRCFRSERYRRTCCVTITRCCSRCTRSPSPRSVPSTRSTRNLRSCNNLGLRFAPAQGRPRRRSGWTSSPTEKPSLSSRLSRCFGLDLNKFQPNETLFCALSSFIAFVQGRWLC